MLDFARLVISAKTEQLKRALRDLNETTVAAGRTDRAVDKTGKAFVKTGVQSKAATGAMAAGMKKAHIAVAALAAAALGLGTAPKVIAEFEKSISKLGAISGATTTQLAEMRDVAKQLGSATEFSAGQAADGLTFLAQAGFTAQESIAAIPAVLDLATASGLGLAAAADTASNIMSGFGIAAGDAARVSDVLAAAAASSNTNVAQLGGAMSTVAPIAAALGIELEDTAAAIGIMSDAGIQGERAGTALRGTLAALAGPTSAATTVLKEMGLTIQDVDPATNSLADVLGKLQGAGLSTADAMTIFGREAASGALVLVKGAEQVGTFTEKLQSADGASKDMAATMRDNLGGDIATLQSSLSGLILALGEAGLTAVLRSVIQVATGVARAFTAIVDAIGDIGASIGEKFDLMTSATTRLQAATDTNSLAIADEVLQVGALFAAMDPSVRMTEIAALGKLREAEAHIKSADAKRADARATILGSEAYLSTVSNIDEMRQALLAMRTAGNDIDQMPLRMRDAYEEVEQSLVAALARQQSLIGSIPTASAEYAAAVAEVERLKTAIANSENGMVDLNGVTINAADTTAALSRLANKISFEGAISSAQQLAKTLGVSVGLAQQLARVNAGGKAIEVNNNGQDALDPRNPNNTRPIFDGDFGTVSPFDPSRIPSLKTSTGGGGPSDEARKAQAEMNDLQSADKSIIEGLRSPMDEYNAALEQADVLLDVGALSMDQYTRHVDQLGKELQNQKPFISDFKNSILDAAMGGENAFDALKKSIIRAGLEYALFGEGAFAPKGGGGGGGFLGGLVKSLFSFDGGGDTGNGARSGGMDGKGGFMAMLHPQETVVDRTKGGNAAPVYNINVYGAKGNSEVREMVSQGIQQASSGLTAQAVSQSQASFRNSKSGWSP